MNRITLSDSVQFDPKDQKPASHMSRADYKNVRVVLTPQLIVVYGRKTRLLSIYALLVNLTVYNML